LTGAGQRLAAFGRVLITDVDQAAQCGVSISEALLDIRLDHLRRRLLAAALGLRVIDIAFDLGFTHLGRMAKAYQVKFGEKPSDTLRRAG
jgi:transcriptional regulator GlxA family with amidase domain